MTEELIGRVMVDSGQVMVGDPCYLKEWAGHEFEARRFDDDDQTGPFGYSYDGACRATLSEAMAGELGGGLAVAVSSGYGDGAYPVYVERDANRRVVAMHVYFDVDPNEDEDEDDEDD